MRNSTHLEGGAGLHFARRGNRFYPALRRAGLIDTDDPAEAAVQLRDRGVGITNLVSRASARADELDPSELLAGRQRLEELVRERQPRVVAVAGITASARRGAKPGRQCESLAEAELWVVPNPSGLNAHETVDSLAAAYGKVARAATVLP